MGTLLDIFLFHSLQRLVQFSSVTNCVDSVSPSHWWILWVFWVVFSTLHPNSIMNTLRRFGAAVRLIFPLRAATLAGRFRLDAFTSNLCISRRTTQNQSIANPNGRQGGSRAWSNCGKSSLQSEYLWRSANRNTLRWCFHQTALSAWLGESATLYNERFSPRIHLSILKAMASERHVVLEVAFYHSAITPFPHSVALSIRSSPLPNP